MPRIRLPEPAVSEVSGNEDTDGNVIRVGHEPAVDTVDTEGHTLKSHVSDEVEDDTDGNSLKAHVRTASRTTPKATR